MPELVESRRRAGFDVWNEVPLVPQLTGMSCWAAAAAMIIGWRDVVWVDPEQVATGAGRWSEYREGLHPFDLEDFARAWGLTPEPRRDWSVDQLRGLLDRFGPVWLGEASPGLHSIVVTGMYGDGTPDGSFVRINDPWPVNAGERYTLSWFQLMTNFHNATDIAGVHAQVMHAGGRRGGPSHTYRFEERHVTRRYANRTSPSKDVVMSHYEDYPIGLDSPVAIATATSAGTVYLDTRSGSSDPLIGHAGNGENLCLVWNAIPEDATAVDVVVHLHGYSGSAPDGAMLRAKVAASGLDLARRRRPTLGIIPRGRKITEVELRARPTANSKRYTFPALLAGNGGGLERLVAFGLEYLKRTVLGSTTGSPLSVDRLIITAHSGGGAPLNQLLSAHAQRRVCNPHEVHVFDALYGDVRGLTAWAQARVAADRQIPATELATRGGGLRIAYGSGTARGSSAVARVLPNVSDSLHAAYRAEETRVGHGDIPRSFGPGLLGDVRSELAARASAQSAAPEGAGWEEGLGVADVISSIIEAVRSWIRNLLANRPAEPLPANAMAWISATDRSGIELIEDEAKRRRFLEEVDWSTRHFPGNGPNSADSTALFAEMARVIPERRVPQGIRFHEPSNRERTTVPATRHSLFTEAATAFVRMRVAARADGVTLTIVSSFRPVSQQQQISARNPNPSAVAQRTSAHSYGLAIDLAMSVSGLAVSETTTRPMTNVIAMYRSPVYKWMALHAREHGWFPFRNEPWHWEYNPPGFKERFEGSRVGGSEAGGGDTYGTPIGLMERYRDHPPEARTEAAGEVPGDIDPDVRGVTDPARLREILHRAAERRRFFTIGIQNTTVFPHSAICQLKMRTARGATYQGTGFYISPNRLLTAAHNIVIPGQTVASVQVAPGKTNDMSTFAPFEVTGAANWVAHPRYSAGSADFDLAIIKVGPPPPNARFFELEELNFNPNTGVVVCGYAARGTGIDRDRQNLDIDAIQELNPESFTYHLHARNGTSGSPTYYSDGARFKAVGVLSRTGGQYRNVGCRLTAEKLRWIRTI